MLSRLLGSGELVDGHGHSTTHAAGSSSAATHVRGGVMVAGGSAVGGGNTVSLVVDASLDGGSHVLTELVQLGLELVPVLVFPDLERSPRIQVLEHGLDVAILEGVDARLVAGDPVEGVDHRHLERRLIPYVQESEDRVQSQNAICAHGEEGLAGVLSRHVGAQRLLSLLRKVLVPVVLHRLDRLDGVLGCVGLVRGWLLEAQEAGIVAELLAQAALLGDGVGEVSKHLHEEGDIGLAAAAIDATVHGGVRVGPRILIAH